MRILTHRVASKMHYTATRCDIPQHTVTHRKHRNTPQHAATYCNTLQQTATQACRTEDADTIHCNTSSAMQRTATHCSTACRTEDDITIYCNTLQHAAIHCNTGVSHGGCYYHLLCASGAFDVAGRPLLQCVAVCCGVLQCHLLFACGPFDIAGKHVF